MSDDDSSDNSEDQSQSDAQTAQEVAAGAGRAIQGMANAANADDAGEGVEAGAQLAEGGGQLLGAAGEALGDEEGGEALRTAGQVVETAATVVSTGSRLAQAAEAGDASGAAGAAVSGAGAASQNVLHGEEAEAAMRAAQAAEAGIGAMGGGGGGSSRHDDVTFDLHVNDFDGLWGIKHMSTNELLNRVGGCSVIAEYDGDVEPSELLRAECLVTISRTSQTRSYKGIVWQARVQSSGHGDVQVTLDIVPAAELLSQCIDTRIFQNKKVPEIIEEVYAGGLDGLNRTVRDDCQETYATREYTVQYQESDLDFICRLAEEEGIFFFFDHEEGDYEVLVLADTVSGLPFVRPDDDGQVPFHRNAGEAPDGEAVIGAQHLEEVGTTDAVVHDYDWTNPGLKILAEQIERGEQEPHLEIYDHTDSVVLHDYGGRQYGDNTAKTQAQLRAERFDLARQDWELSSSVVSAAAGYQIEVVGCPDASLDQRYLIVGVSSFGRATEGRQGSWQNTLQVAPASMPYRPARKTIKPIVPGLESAVVVGPSGEEIHTDEHGRVKVQFHWDRQGRKDENSSCWLRVMQSWAGPGFGTQFLPRIGMEVMVSFLGGNPDRPLVIGCVYNGQNVSPVTHPDDKTQSAIRTKSSPNSDGFNEIRFEDKAGDEFIYTHAQKDYNEVVEHCHSTHVKVDQSNTVDHDQTETVGNDQTLTVENNRQQTVKKDEIVTIEGYRCQTVHDNEDVISKSSRNRVCTIDDTITVEKGDRTILVKTGEERETYKGGRDTTVHAHDNLRTLDGANRNETITGQRNQWVTKKYNLIQGDTEKFILDGEGYWESAKRIQVVAGDASVDMKKGGDVFIDAPEKIVLRSGDSAIELSPSGIKIQGPQVEIVGGNGATMAKFDSSEIQQSGPKVSVTGQTFVTISSMIIRLN